MFLYVYRKLRSNKITDLGTQFWQKKYIFKDYLFSNVLQLYSNLRGSMKPFGFHLQSTGLFIKNFIKLILFIHM